MHGFINLGRSLSRDEDTASGALMMVHASFACDEDHNDQPRKPCLCLKLSATFGNFQGFIRLNRLQTDV